MVQIKDDKLIITIQTSTAVSDLTNYQNSILTAIKSYKEVQGEDDATVLYLGELLNELLPTFEQNKVLFSTATN